MGGGGDIWHVGTNYQWGNTQLVAQGGRTNADATGGASGVAARQNNSFTVGAIHSLSKRTSLFGGYQRVTQNATGANAGAITGVTDGENASSEAGGSYGSGSRNTWTMGMRHNF